MDKRISGLIRHFDGLASPTYVPETPLPRDPGKSASLPLAEALSTVEPGATATGQWKRLDRVMVECTCLFYIGPL